MPNKLINEQSPYLLQHAHNPVNWYPWSDEAFEKAALENKPVLVSIGYSACHWCHVMERESFENEETAAFMNRFFINIKVDREEHPDVDHLYMDAVQAISGRGGWPLNVFTTPGRLPFYGGTYFPPVPLHNRPSWLEILMRIHEIWTRQPTEVKLQAGQMLEFLKNASQITYATEDISRDKNTYIQAAEQLLKIADKRLGGFGKAPKFPGTMAISFLLEHYHFTGNEEAKAQALLSLEAMLNGGIYDHLGGGLARYSTDANWLAPHFEKMLYDNALLIIALCDAWLVSQKSQYKKAIYEIIDFADRELKDPTGVYYSALDADSEGVEGKFYTWTYEEWKSISGGDEMLEKYFGIRKEGNWEHTNILHQAVSVKDISETFGEEEVVLLNKIEAAQKKLFIERTKRIRPQTDDKSLLSWNALMNMALSKTAAVFNDEALLARAKSHLGTLLDFFQKNDRLKHVWKQGEARIEANLDDYAYLIKALLLMASVTGEENYILKAASFCETTISEFSHESGCCFYFTSTQQNDIPVRKLDLHDGATPSANAMMAENLFLLGMCMERNNWTDMASQMLMNTAESVLRHPYSFGYWAMVSQRLAAGMKTIVFSGTNRNQDMKRTQQIMLPQCYLLTSQKEISELPILRQKYFTVESVIFVCTEQSCLSPVNSVDSALRLI